MDTTKLVTKRRVSEKHVQQHMMKMISHGASRKVPLYISSPRNVKPAMFKPTAMLTTIRMVTIGSFTIGRTYLAV